MNLTKLKDPFPANDIEWRIQQSGVKNNKPWAMVLAYVTNRAIMDRLDEICGPENWVNNFKEGPNGGLLCGIGIKCGDEWVTKWDGADNTQVEAIKGGLSAAMKRAGSQWGIGRYLYKLEATFADIIDKGKHRGQAKGVDGKAVNFKWATPSLPRWALPKGPTPIKEMIDKFAVAKGVLNKKTGSNEVYYAALDTLKVKHANEIKKVADGNKLLAEFRTFLTPKEDQTPH